MMRMVILILILLKMMFPFCEHESLITLEARGLSRQYDSTSSVFSPAENIIFITLLLLLNGDEGKKDAYKHYIDFLLNLSTMSTLF